MTDPAALVLLLRTPDTAPAELHRPLATLADALRGAGATAVYLGGCVDRNPVLDNRYVGASHFDAVVEARFADLDAVARAIAGDLGAAVGDGLAGLAVDGTGSVVAVGSQLLVEDEGGAALHVHVALHRPAALAVGEFRRAWIEDFTPIVRQTPTQRGYRQVHVDAEASTALAARLGLGGAVPDGIACGYFDDGDGLAESSAWVAANARHRSTLESFVDVPRCRSILSTPLGA